MMGSAIDGIVDCEIGDHQQAWASLCDLLPHVRGPFMLVSEQPINECLSFITGIGGLLQLIMNGFAGLRLHEDGMKFKPCLPPEVQGLTLHGLHFNGIPHQVSIIDDQAHIQPMH
jgi:hypothetical protein